jgi:thiol-disulfide isomerase/thioredoxin
VAVGEIQVLKKALFRVMVRQLTSRFRIESLHLQLGSNYTYQKDRVAVVNVWASWCSPCRAEAPTLVALANKYTDVAFIGILTRDNPANAEAFERRFKIPYPTVIDDSILIGFKGSLPANAIPTTVILDKTGRVAARISGVVTVASLSKLIEKVSAE